MLVVLLEQDAGPADNPKLVCKTPVTVEFSVSVSDFMAKNFVTRIVPER